jgi:hypothetical protein
LATIASLIVNVAADVSELKTGMAEATGMLEHMGETMFGATAAANLFTDGLEKLGEIAIETFK